MKHFGTKQTVVFTLGVCVWLVFIGQTLFAGVPHRISFQGALTTAAGAPVSDGAHSVSFTIYDAASGGIALWSSGLQSVTTSSGQFSYELGSVVGLPDDVFVDTTRWLGITVVPDPEMTPRTKLNAVPFAFEALHADLAQIAKTAADADALGNLPASQYSTIDHTHDSIYVNESGDVMTGPLGFSNSADPMLEMYQSGATNSEKTVIAHSPAYPTWGLHYNDLTDAFSFIGGSDTNLVIDLNATGDASIQTDSGAINAGEMFNEPGVSTGKQLSVSVPDSFRVPMCSTFVDAPSDGFVFVIATGELHVSHLNPGSSPSWVEVFLDTTSGYTSPWVYSYLWGYPAVTPAGQYTSRFSLTDVFPVSAGHHAYFLQASRCPCSYASVSSSRITAMFFPTSYGVVEGPSAISSERMDRHKNR